MAKIQRLFATSLRTNASRVSVAVIALLGSLVLVATTSESVSALATSGPITSLTLSNSTLTEQSGSILNFDATFVPGSTTSTSLTATFASGTLGWSTGASSGSLTSGSASSIPLERGNNTITLTHTLSGTNTMYHIYIARAGIFSNLQILTPGVTLTPAWDPAVHSYTLTNVPYTTTSIDYVVTESYNEAGHLECNHCNWWQYNSRGTQQMTLSTGANHITWHHYANPGYYQGAEDYTIDITRAGAFDSSHLTGLTLSNSTLTEQSGQLYKFDATTVAGATTGVTATFSAGTATWSSGSSSGSLTSGTAATVGLNAGNNTITVTHTLNGTSTSYVMYVARAGVFSNLQILTPGVTLTPAWDPAIRSYTLTNVPYSVNAIDYVVTESYDEPGHLECDHCSWWQYNSRGTQQMTLSTGANHITWHHHSTPGNSAGDQDYTIDIVRGDVFDSTHFTNLTLTNSTLTEQTGQMYTFDAEGVAGNVTSTGVIATFNAGSATWSSGTHSGSLTSGTSSSVPLARGNNTITIAYVRSGVTTTYTINISRDGQFTLFQLMDNGMTLTPAWNPAIHYYRISDVSSAVAVINYQVTESYNDAGHLECDHCGWWQFNSRGTQQMTISAGANCIRWSHYAGPGYYNRPEYYYIAVNRGAPGLAPTGDCDPSTAPTTTTTTTTTSTTSTSSTTIPSGPTTTVVGGGGSNSGPVTTIAQGQSAVATIAPTSSTIAAVSQTKTTVASTTTSTTLPPEITSSGKSTKPAPTVEELEKGEVALTIAGKKTILSVNRSMNQLILNGGGITLTVSVLSPDNTRVPLDNLGGLRFNEDDKVVVKATGVASEEEVSMWMFSTPTEIGTVRATIDGTMAGTFSLPKSISSGQHRLVLQGKNATGEAAVLGIAVSVGEISKTSMLSRLLIAVPITLAVFFGVILPTQARRRRRRVAA